MVKRWTLSAALVIVIVLLVGGFASIAVAGAKGKLVVAFSSDIGTLDPQAHNSRLNFIVGWHLYDNLVIRDQKTMEIAPHLAESWNLLDDHTWEFKLRKGVKFESGEPFNADSVKFTVERAVEPKSPIRPSFSWIKEVRIVDEHTVRIISEKPYPPALERLVNFQMLPPRWVKEKGADTVAVQANGTGPYRLIEWKRGAQIVLEAKEDYWRGAPAIKTIVIRPIKEIATQLSELVTGGVDIVRDVPPDQVALIEGSGIARISKAPTLRVVWVSMDVDGRAGKSPVQNLKVRQAINHAIDVNTILKTVMNGNGTRTAAVLNPQHFGYDKSLENAYPYNPDKAKQLLREANFNADQPLKLVTYMGSIQNSRALAEAVAGYLNKAGIKTSVNVYSDVGMYDRLTREGKIGDLHIHSEGSGGIYDADALYYLHFRSGGPYTYASSPEMDKWLDQARSTLDQNLRKQLYRRAGKHISDQALTVPLYAQESILGLNKRVIYEAPPDEFLRTFDASLRD